MNTIEAFMRGEAARACGAKQKVFDWHKAASIIRERKAQNAAAGLAGDWEYTGGEILRDG